MSLFSSVVTFARDMLDHVEKLPNAPLQEVIFELHWKLDVDPASGIAYDSNFDIAAGRFDVLASTKLPFSRRLIPSLAPLIAFPHKPVLQYWKEEGIYPVMQIGHGIFTANETEKNYQWHDFKAVIEEGLEWLHKSYKNNLFIEFVELRYIDAIEITPEDEKNLLDYLNKNLNVSIVNSNEIPGSLSDFQLIQKLRLDNGDSLNLVFANGVRNIEQSKVLLWHTSVSNSSQIKRDNLTDWVEKAHQVCSDLFRKMISPELYERFNKKD